MAALVRAGIPLEQGLTAFALDAPGRARLDGWSAGRPPAERAGPGGDPAAGRVEFSAGVAQRGAGRDSVRAIWQRRWRGCRRRCGGLRNCGRAIAVSLIYPFIVVAIAFGFLVFSLTHLAPILMRTYHDLVSQSDPYITLIERACRALDSWALWIPIVRRCCVLWWWLRSGRAIRTVRGTTWGAGPIPVWPIASAALAVSVTQAIRDGRMATFAELLRLMNDHQVPMPEAVVLAADASGDRVLSRGARQIAERLESGAVLRTRNELPIEFPPLLGWSIVTGAGQVGMSRALAASAEMYRQRAAQAAPVGIRVSADHPDRHHWRQCGAAPLARRVLAVYAVVVSPGAATVSRAGHGYVSLYCQETLGAKTRPASSTRRVCRTRSAKLLKPRAARRAGHACCGAVPAGCRPSDGIAVGRRHSRGGAAVPFADAQPPVSLSAAEASELAGQVAQVMRAKVPLAAGLRAAAEETADGASRWRSQWIADQADQGRSLEDTLAHSGRLLPSLHQRADPGRVAHRAGWAKRCSNWSNSSKAMRAVAASIGKDFSYSLFVSCCSPYPCCCSCRLRDGAVPGSV